VAARGILDEAGPDVVGLRETARRVGVSATAAYRHYANKEDLLASVAAERFRELAAAMETGATESDPLHGAGLAYVGFALQKRGLFRLMFGTILVERAKYPQLNEAASAVFDFQRVAVGADEEPAEDNSAGMAGLGAWFMARPPCSSTASSPRRTQEVWRKRFSPKRPDQNTNPPPSECHARLRSVLERTGRDTRSRFRLRR